MPVYTMNAHPLIRDMKILQISLAVEDFAPYSPWWLETGSWGGTLMHMSLSPPHLPLASEASFTGNTPQLL